MRVFLPTFIGDFEKAAQLCPEVFAQDAKAWEEEVFTFLKFNQLQVHMSAPHSPTSF